MIKIFKISGNSLYPFYKDKERIVCIKVFKFTRIKQGDFVVFDKQPYGLMVKRVEYVKDNRYFVQGEDPLSVDSRNFGLLSLCEIKYKLWFALLPK